MSACVCLSQGQEYVEQYKLEYQREYDGRWFIFRNRRNHQVIAYIFPIIVLYGMLCIIYPNAAVAKICRKIWGSGSVRTSHQTVPDYTLHQRFPNTQHSQFLTTGRRIEKNSLPSILTQFVHP